MAPRDRASLWWENWFSFHVGRKMNFQYHAGKGEKWKQLTFDCHEKCGEPSASFLNKEVTVVLENWVTSICFVENEKFVFLA